MWNQTKPVIVAAAIAGAVVASNTFVHAQGDGNRVTVPFSDPSRPGLVRLNMFRGSIRVTATTGREVVVVTDDTVVTRRDGREVSVPPKPETVGLRRLTQPSGLQIVEENNVVSISNGRFMNGDDVTIQVPSRTNLNLSAFNDEIEVEGIDGEIEVTSMNGEITLTDVSGSVVAHATNGDVRVTLRQLRADKPMAFTSLNGDVDVTLPASVKANLKLRSDRGEVYTDFDVQLQQRAGSPQAPTPAPKPGDSFAPPLPPLPPQPPFPGRAPRKGRVEVDTSIYGTVNGGGPEFELRTFNGDVFLRRGK
jgi:hypothetical protein